MKRLIMTTTILAIVSISTSVMADTQWTGAVGTDWGVAGNWNNGLPSAAANTTYVNANGAGAPIVSDYQTTNGIVFMEGGSRFSVVSGGTLVVGSELWNGVGANQPILIDGGVMKVTGLLNMGFGNEGDIIVTNGGHVTAEWCQINTGSANNATGAALQVRNGGQFTIADVGNSNSGLFLAAWASTGTVVDLGPGGIIDVSAAGSTGVRLSASAGQFNISGDGQLIIYNDSWQISEINTWTNLGFMTVNGLSGSENLNFDYTTLAGENKVIVTAIPEPATLALLGLGVLAALKKKK